MTEEELFEIVSQELPVKEISICLSREHWRFSTETEEVQYKLSLIPSQHVITQDVVQFDSKEGWQEIYDKYLARKEELNA